MSVAAPQVSVIMPVYNAGRFIRAAVDSVLEQSYRDWELILIDDGSRDASPSMLAAYDDARIIKLRNDENRGLISALNRGVEAARAPLLARLDADDIAEPCRLEKQVAAMRRRPELDLLGTWTIEIDADDQPIGEFSFPASEALIRWGMTITNVIYHPTVMMRRQRMEEIGAYDPAFLHAEDYDLFTRILMAGGRVAMLPERLIRYRRTAGQISSLHVDQQQSAGAEIRRRYLRWLLNADHPAETIRAATRLQAAHGDSPDTRSLHPALLLVRAIRQECAARADAASAREIAKRVRDALLYHAANLRTQGRLADAGAVWAEAARSGSGAWRRPATWLEPAHLARALMRSVVRRRGLFDPRES